MYFFAMHTKLMRAFVSTLSGMVLTVLLGGALAAPKVHASGPVLLISEVNWAGSAANANDEWVELYNPSPASIDLSTTPFHLYAGGVEVVALTTGVIPGQGHYLVSKLDPASVPSSTLAIAPDVVAPSLVLSDTALQVQLKDAAAVVVDTAGNNGAPLAGMAGSAAQPGTASMARVNAVADGSTAAAWTTSHTIGAGLKASVGVTPNAPQFATPANRFALFSATLNPESAVPSNLAVTPLAPTSTTPTVTGKVVPTGGQTLPATVKVTFQKVGEVGEVSFVTTVSPIDGSFSVTTTPLAAGMYRINVVATDFTGNRSAAIEVPIPDPVSPQHLYVVNAAAPTVTPPTLNSYPGLVNVPVVTLSGTVQAGTAVVVSVNGTNVAQDMLGAGVTTFSLPVELVPNTVNKIEVRAKDSAGNVSAPTIAIITHDSLAPVVNVSLLKLTANPTGTNDTVSGMAGMTEAGATVEVYADQALTQKIASGVTAADGSLAALSIGDNKYAKVYVVAKDQVGNVSAPVALDNTIAYAGGTPNFGMTVTNIGQDTATLKWNAIAGAVNYHLKYKVNGGTYSPVIELCAGTCTLERKLISLSSNTTYTLALAAVDAAGNESPFEEYSFTTSAPATTTTTTVSSTPSNVGGNVGPVAPIPTQNPEVATNTTGATDSVSKSTATPAPSPSASPSEAATATPAPTDQNGEVKSAEDNGSARNWTPWIILAILIGLAVLATAGYFYWFGGEAGDGIPTDDRNGADSKTISEEKVSTRSRKASDETQPSDKKDKTKRW